jgi:hypothetical protein
MRLDINTAKNVTMIAIGAMGMLLAPNAHACGERPGQARLIASGLFATMPGFQTGPSFEAAQPTLPQIQDHEESNSDHRHGSIVGMWIVNFFVAGQVWDVAIEQFYADGNEMTNDLAFPPSQENVCYGVWERAGNNTYKMKHIGWAYGPNDVYIGRFDFEATLLVGDHGNSFTGKFVADQEDLSGNPIQALHAEGTLKATRFTVD